MTTPNDAASLTTDHREALREFVETASQMPQDAWNAAPASGKWSPGQVTEHLLLTYRIARGELAGREGFRIRTSWWKQRFFQWLILPRILDGRFPRGVPAVREIRPGPGPYDRAMQLRAMSEDGEHFIREMSGILGQARKFSHPFLGKLIRRSRSVSSRSTSGITASSYSPVHKLHNEGCARCAAGQRLRVPASRHGTP